MNVTVTASLLLFKLTFLGGMTAWLAMVSFSNVISFPSGAGAIGRMMSMAPLDEAPRIEISLRSRSVTSPGWHRLTYAVLLVIEFAAMVLLANATVRMAFALGDASLVEAATVHANIALAGLLTFSFVMLLGGTWFAYYIRQEGHLITHLVLIGVTLAGLLTVNLH